MSERELPNDVNAEAGLLAIFFRQKECEAITECLDSGLSPTMFYNKKFELIAWACLELYAVVQPINKETVVAMLKEQGKLEEAGGEETVAEIEKRQDGEGYAPYYIEIIKEKAWRRKLVETAVEMIDKNLSHPDKALAEQIRKYLKEQKVSVAKDGSLVERYKEIVEDGLLEMFAKIKKEGYSLRDALEHLTGIVERLNKNGKE